MSSNSVVSLVVYGVVAAFGVIINVLVLISFVRGRLASSQYSSIYILALQTLIVDVIFITIHLFYWIPKAINPDFLSVEGYDSFILHLVDSIGTYAWFHNALSHVFIASNRFVVLVFFERSFFTRRRVIIMAIVHHFLALTITLLTQFAIPCCRLSFNFSIFSYFNVPNGDLPNYSDIFFTVPVNTLSTVTSLVCYTTIFITVRRERTATKSMQISDAKRKSEYSYALQFASLAGVFSFCWISFRVFPFIIPLSDPNLVWVFGLTTVFTMVNCFMNALVYLVNNKDVGHLFLFKISSLFNREILIRVQRNLPSLYGYEPTLIQPTTMYTVSSVGMR